MNYDSPPTTTEEQLELLSLRGMVLPDRDRAAAFLNQVSYYRFSGYALHYEIFENRKRTHKFKEGTSFDDVVQLYDFDSKLRSLLFDSIQDIEVAFRTQLCLKVSLKTADSHWPLNPGNFSDRFDHGKFVQECEKETQRSREIFIESYKKKYTQPEAPAAWMLIEIVSFGSWSRVYSSLSDEEVKKDIARYFQVKPYILKSWVHSLTVLRNQCAHHARIWNASLSISPALTNKMEKAYPITTNKRKRIVLMLDIISELLKPLDKYEGFISSLNELLDEYPTVPEQAMGLSARVLDLNTGVRR
ncbi:Abi family protein [Oceanispirochaeta sp.]|uniref:Abi family protein n=1 Tax=Oceanispirochaeta sp. TaxID=2035350 RepID=UPI002606164D|nr:Abi family protein [Oceanispirochaeta sp.]MDA3955837.1 Abi family protein [Oceanispirochaeta sp.]